MILELLLTATLVTTPSPPECPEGMIHYPPLCLTVEQHRALVNPQPPMPVYEYIEGVEQWRPMIAYFWGKHGVAHVDRMLRIMWCESRGRWWVMNEQGSGAEGLLQIMQFWKKVWPGNYKDPWTNAAVAYQIWLSQGYGAWSCKG